MYAGSLVLLCCVTWFGILHDVIAEFTLTILHTNDVHARVEQMSKYGSRCSDSDAAEGKCYGGVARRVTAVRQLRNKHKNVLLLDAGDQFQGTPWFTMYGGDEAAYFMTKVGYDVMTIGNHEFDNGPEGLGRFLGNVSFPVVSANIDASREPSLRDKFRSSVVLTVDGRKLGVIGYTFKDTPLIGNPGKKLTFSDEIVAVRAEAERLKARGMDILIALGHSGFETDQKMAAEVADIDVVVGGHTNTFLYTGSPPSIEKPKSTYPHVVTQPSGKRVPVVQDYAFGKYLGELELVFEDNGELTSWAGNPVLLNSSYTQDNAVLQEVDKWKEKLVEFRRQEVGATYVQLLEDRLECRERECNLGNLITDAVIHANLRTPAGSSWTTASIAMWGAGGIRAAIAKGPIVQDDVMSVLPFRDEITMVTLRGSDLLAALEHSVVHYGTDYLSGKFLQVSGLRIVYDLERSDMERVVSVRVRCQKCQSPEYEALNQSATYNVLTSKFIANGGDGFFVMKNKLREVYIGTVVADAVSSYIKKISPVTIGLEDRIVFAKNRDVTCGAAGGPLISISLSIITVLLAISYSFMNNNGL